MSEAADRAERMRRALALVRAALDQPEAGREAWLATRCAGQPDLHAEALGLLRLDHAPPHALERLCTEAGADEAGDDPLAGREVGRFRIVRRLGSGGMGTVYRAEPVAGVARQPVALKLIKRGMDSEEIVARFLREREILARLDHPHIARLLDGGITADGQPWFAMELVDGEPLLAWCDARRLGLDARIGLFLAACDAVAYAHRNLVVHRDLKPANVLVTGDGTLKLLDFGIAKLLDAGDDGVTRGATPLMTPEYAAPEQFAHGPVTTQTDVFQLGVLLHELLGGLRPAASRGTARIEAQLRERRARDPEAVDAIARARGVGVATLLRSLHGDLDRIVRRAMHAEPERRYASVAALADDLQRFRRGEPVSATGDTPAYRLRMFLRRHRVGVAATAAVLLSLALGLGLALRSAHERGQAERATESALALLEDVFLGADPYEAKGGDTRATDLLAHARRRIEADIAGQPAIAARLLEEIGGVYVSLDDRAAAEDALRAALQAGERAGVAALVPTEAARARLAHYALVVDGDKARLSDLDTAIERLRAAGPAGRRVLAQALEFKADHLFNIGDYAAIPDVSAQAVEMHRLASGDGSDDYAMALANHASLLRAVGHNDAMLAAATQAQQIVAALGDTAAPAVRLYVQQQYAGALAANGRAREAEPVLRGALAVAIAMRGPDSNLAIGIAWELAGVQDDIGRFDAAAQGLRALLTHAGAKSANLAGLHNALGRAELALGHAAVAEGEFAQAQPLVCADGPATPPCLAVRLNRSEASLALGRLDEARTALAALDADIGDAGGRARQRWQLIESRRRLAAGDVAGAHAVLAPLLAAVRAAGVGSIDDAQVLVQAAAIEERRGERDAALADYRAAEQRMAATWVEVPVALADVRAHVASLAAAP
ncbi:MAG: protein kinase [Rhodanobacteraceae bacterium]|jgi:serine/threonine-protein kinase|nr:protein kinase [Rhodanobacteraceae bacterium]